MWHNLDISPENFFQQQLQTDRKVVEQARERGCPCGGRLHRADYPRKPRGVPDGCERYVDRRFSLCCATPGCRRRCTPPSVRFMGRRVYLAAVILMACASFADVDATEIPTRTRRRWRTYFTSQMVESASWQEIRGYLRHPVDERTLPGSLLECFKGPRSQVVISALKLLLYGPTCGVF